MRALGFIIGIVGIGAGVWVTFGEHDLSGLIGVIFGVAVLAICFTGSEAEFE